MSEFEQIKANYRDVKMKNALKLLTGASLMLLIVEAQAGQPLIKPGPGHQCFNDTFDLADVDMVMFDEFSCDLNIPAANTYRRVYFGNSRFDIWAVPDSPDKVVAGCFRREFEGEHKGTYSIHHPDGSVRYEDVDSFAEIGISPYNKEASILYSPIKCD